MGSTSPEILLERVRGEDQRAGCEAIAKKIRAAVEAGEITEEQAKEKLEACQSEKRSESTQK